MAKKYTSFNPSQTPQTEPLAGRDQITNNAGGYVFAIDDWKRLDRFLLLGSDGATYYQTEKALTAENGRIVVGRWLADAERTAKVITEISVAGRAPRQSPAIFALALGAVSDKPEARQAAYAAVQAVCRTASHLFEWLHYCSVLGKGWGRGMKRVVAEWYKARPTDKLAFQMVKFRERNGFTHKRAIELSNRGAGEDAERKALYLWARGKEVDKTQLPQVVQAHLTAMASEKADKALLSLVAEHTLPWEAIPNQFLREPKVWEVMQPTMGLTALIRNLGNMTEVGAIGPNKTKPITDRLADAETLKKARVHPFNVLQALAVYKSGKGFRGSKVWKPESKVTDALDEAFYKAFTNVEPTGKRFYIGLDVSGSMSAPMMNSALTCREAGAALALITVATEPESVVYGFSSPSGRSRASAVMKKLDITPKRRLDDIVRDIHGIPFGTTDCSLPMQHAAEEGILADVFVVITDNESYAGRQHPVEALRAYRKQTGINAKLAVIAMTSTGFSIADPTDGGMLDMVGFDSNGPAILAEFAKD